MNNSYAPLCNFDSAVLLNTTYVEAYACYRGYCPKCRRVVFSSPMKPLKRIPTPRTPMQLKRSYILRGFVFALVWVVAIFMCLLLASS